MIPWQITRKQGSSIRLFANNQSLNHIIDDKHKQGQIGLDIVKHLKGNNDHSIYTRRTIIQPVEKEMQRKFQ
jgi:hypothetical protein